jgi:hypothetical protein
MVGFSAVSTILADIYETGSLIMTLCTLAFLIAFIPMNFVVIRCLETKGLRYCLMTCAVLTIIGGWIRQLISVYPQFWIVFIGTLPIAIGQPFLINSVSKLSSVWFGDNEVRNTNKNLILCFIERSSNVNRVFSYACRMRHWVCSSNYIHH